MKADNLNYKIIAATAMGALGGLLLAGYLYNTREEKRPLSKHLAALSKLIEQFEGVEDVELETLKKKIESLLTTIETNYGKSEE